MAKDMRDERNIIFVFVGDGVEKERLMNRARDEGIDNVFFLPPVSKRAIPDLLGYYDVSYMTGMPSPLYRFGLCLNKMYDSMMAGIPIICAFDAPDTLVRQYECGYQCDPNDRRAVTDSIRRLYGMSEAERTEMGNRGKKAVLDHYTYKRLAEDFLKIMEER